MIKQSNQHPKNQSSNFLRYFAVLSAFIFLSVVSYANTFYISSSTGNDAYSISQAQDQTSPWKSINKLNSILNTLSRGDVILFKSGDTFYGTLTTTVSGITFGAYGSGSKPIITGLTTISSWSNTGGNIWEAAVPGGLSTLNMVLINGVLTPMGRYPNLNASNGGYLTYESFVLDKSLTDNQLSSSPNWTGGEVVFRRMDYTMDRAKITNHSGNTINFNTYAGPSMTAGYGYFIENHLFTLDQNGEWFYDATAKKIKIYYSGTPPTIQVSTLTNLVNIVNTSNTQKSNITFKGLSFKGCEGVMMLMAYCSNTTVDNCDFSFAGVNAIEYGSGVTYLTVQNSTINNINMVGIHESSNYLTSNVTIQNNNIQKIGLNAGMISNAYGQGTSSIGINVGAGNLIIKENILDQIGYNPISLKQNANNQLVQRNVISNFCSVKNDGAAIYNVGQRGAPAASNVVFENNIISKDVGAMAGTNSTFNKHTKAIYLDATTVGVQVLNNTIFDCWDGICVTQSQNNVVSGNTVYNTGNYKPSLNYFSGALVVNDANNGYAHNSNNTITNNIFFAKNYDQLLYYQTDQTDKVGTVGLIDNNFYVNPWTDMPLYMTNTTTASKLTTYSWPLWNQAFSNYDKNSKVTPVKIPQYSYAFVGSNKIPNSTFTSSVTGASASSSPAVHSLTWDNTSQITAGGSAKLTSSVTSPNFTNFYEIVGAIDASKNYVLRFKTKGTKLGSFKTYLQQWSGSYSIISSTQAGSVDINTQQHEIVFTGEHSTQSNVAVLIQFSQNSGSVYIDNVEFYEANITPTNVDDYIRFEYNTTTSPVNVSLPNVYVAADGTVYKTGSITIQPFTSKILIKDTSQAIAPGTPVPPATLTAVSSAGVITTAGGTTTLTVTASGGTKPYTGTGNFNVKAGTYNLLVKDSLGASTTTSITISDPVTGAPLTASSTAGTITAIGGTTTLTVNAAGGVPPYNGTGNFTVKAGSYNILVKDSKGASITTSITINDPVAIAPLKASSIAGKITAIGGTTTLTVTATGGTPTYNGTGNFTVKAGTYNILVKDSKGASTTTSITIDEPVPTVPLTASSSAGIIKNTGGTTTVTVSAFGGTPPYNGTGNFTVKAGYYNILVKDSKGVSTTTSITITEPGTARLATVSIETALIDSSLSISSTRQTLTQTATPDLQLKVYPNPSNAEFRLMVDGGNNELIGITVLSADGKVVYSLSGRSGNSFRFGSDWAPGLYFIRVSQANTLKTIKAIKS